MSVVFRYRGFRFFFYSNEGDPLEPPHISRSQRRLGARFWLVPEVLVAYNEGHDARILRELLGVIEETENSF